MEKKKLFILITFVLVLVSLLVFFNLEKGFNKKQDCFTMKEPFVKSLEKERDYILKVNREVYDGRTDLKVRHEISQIFYSKEKNSCLAAYKEVESWNNKKDIYIGLVIKDMLTNETYFTFGYHLFKENGERISEINNEWIEKIKELKDY